MVFPIAPHIPRKKKKPAEQDHEVFPHKLSKFTAGILRIQNKAPKPHL